MEAPEPPEGAPVVPPMPPAELFRTDPQRFLLETEQFILALRAYREWLARR